MCILGELILLVLFVINSQTTPTTKGIYRLNTKRWVKIIERLNYKCIVIIREGSCRKRRRIYMEVIYKQKFRGDGVWNGLWTIQTT